MKKIHVLAWILLPALVFAQTNGKTENVFIITVDGFRWQELFTGADSALLFQSPYTADTALARAMFWDQRPDDRRKKLLPFFWNVVATRGKIWGNRSLDNKVNVRNFFKISYPGYNEILTGYPDPFFIPNTPVMNPNRTILEKLNELAAYNGRVAAFASWNRFPFILNEDRSGMPINAGYEQLEEHDSLDHFLNLLQEGVKDEGHTRIDWITYLSAKEYIQNKHPRILLLALGETDAAAHAGRYDVYLQKAAMVDKMIGDLWCTVQADEFYRDKTSFIITTDHGRGRKPQSWAHHGTLTAHSGETWIAALGPDLLPPFGEITDRQQIYSSQIPATIQAMLGDKAIDFSWKSRSKAIPETSAYPGLTVK